MHVAKRPRVLDPQPGQLVDVEEAPVVDAGHREPPVGEAVVLPLQQPVQRVDAGLVVGAVGRKPALDDRRGAFDRGEPLLQRRRLLRRTACRAAHIRSASASSARPAGSSAGVAPPPPRS